MIFLNIILTAIFIYLSVCVLYAFLFALAGRVGKVTPSKISETKKKFAVFLPGYKEDEVILSSAKEALKQSYPKEFYDVIVIADSMQPDTIEKLNELPVKVLEVKFEKSTKARSLNEAFKRLPEIYDFVLILDADNIMAPDFLEKINGKIQETGVQAIQGHRVAKNLNTRFAVLDGISEEVNNHIYRKGHRILGLSSGLIGSGMAFEYSMYKEVMKTIDAIGGFDKESELKLLKNKVKIEYAEDALVYDEKVESSEVFGNQRRRWISAQIHYFKKFFFLGVWHLLTKGNVDFFDKAFQQFLMPRVLLMGTTFVLTALAVVAAWFNIPTGPHYIGWVMLSAYCLGGILLAVPNKFYSRDTFEAMAELPKAMFVMFLTLFRLKGANKKFIHTPHKVRDISA